jgi:hypothetical protein
MNDTGLLRLPPAVWVLFLVMLWPAIWAVALMTVALAGDVMRQWKSIHRTGVGEGRRVSG